MKKSIIIRGQFTAFHKWDQAPQEVDFLRNLHRHIFHVKLGIPVNNSDREREFFIEKRKLEEVTLLFEETCSSTSCEMFAEEILQKIPHAIWCEVWEDNENGARVERN